jgi:uncharacterized membrane protein
VNVPHAKSLKSRLEYIDLLRGITVVILIFVHTQMFYLSPSFYSGYFYKIVDEASVTPGPGMFLFLMGYVFSLQKDLSWKAVGRRALWLLLAAYLLNVLRQALPHYLWGLHHKPDYWESVLMIDILHMAAPSLLLLNLIRRWSSIWLLLILALIVFFSSYFWGLTSTPGILDIVWGKGNWVFFPLLPWFSFCVLGLLCWRMERYFQNGFILVGVTVMALGWALERFNIWTGPLFNFYRSSPASLLWMLGFSLIALVVAKKVTLNSGLQKIIYYLSRHVTKFYFFSWLWITWLCFYFGYQRMNSWQVFVLSGVILVLTSGTVWLWNKVLRNRDVC